MFKLYRLSNVLRMRCPNCKHVLSAGEERRFTDSADHVCDPNNEYGRPLRPTLVCTHCEFRELGFWDMQGGFYSNSMLRRNRFPKLRSSAYSGLFSFDWFHRYDMKIYWLVRSIKMVFGK